MGVAENIDARLLYIDFKKKGLFNGGLGSDGYCRLTLGVSGAAVKLLETEDILKMASSRLPIRSAVNSEEGVYPYSLKSGETGEVYLSAASLFWENRSRRWRLMVAVGRNIARANSGLELCCSLNEIRISKQLGRDFVLAAQRHPLVDETELLPALLDLNGKQEELQRYVVSNVAGLVVAYISLQKK